jgi:tRNA (cmo5U34)-methyltransferase
MDIDKISDRFNQTAENYDKQRKYFIPCFDDYYASGISFLADTGNNFKSILDLGAGTGLLTQYLYEKFPSAEFTLLDVSEQMLEVARLRFYDKNNFIFSICDYSKELPAGLYDLIASALSIHHLENYDKAKLYSNIYDKLGDGGYFINIDQFNASSKFINDNYNKWWYKFISTGCISEKDRDAWLKRRELDRENTIDETKSMLKDAGFKTLECIYSYMKFGVVLAIKH